MRTYSDEHLEYYADRFIRLRIARHGVTLAQYLINPAQFERLALEPEPLLPAQQAAVLRFCQRWDTGLAAISEQQSGNDDIEAQATGWDWRDLIEQWRDEVAQSEREVCQLSQRNGAAFEPMRHHRHNRGMNRGTANFERKQARKGA
ncbi:hypothetical protein [Vreelandella titanicae]|jgi:hypothetical protein|uniref:hypothetical protein n=1 Tax=Vreelandella titanicae TaxID=664683 RepID=UPI0015946E4E|nr:hypothetical protein [Halomonas titanicae]NVE91571.1 hypothetical protein [Halomonas titanicae]|tara:strand:+ start:388 stop:828 length:441 start_codon:yes stop_codon:yes gene_type:complete